MSSLAILLSAFLIFPVGAVLAGVRPPQDAQTALAEMERQVTAASQFSDEERDRLFMGIKDLQAQLTDTASIGQLAQLRQEIERKYRPRVNAGSFRQTPVDGIKAPLKETSQALKSGNFSGLYDGQMKGGLSGGQALGSEVIAESRGGRPAAIPEAAPAGAQEKGLRIKEPIAPTDQLLARIEIPRELRGHPEVRRLAEGASQDLQSAGVTRLSDLYALKANIYEAIADGKLDDAPGRPPQWLAAVQAEGYSFGEIITGPLGGTLDFATFGLFSPILEQTEEIANHGKVQVGAVVLALASAPGKKIGVFGKIGEAISNWQRARKLAGFRSKLASVSRPVDGRLRKEALSGDRLPDGRITAETDLFNLLEGRRVQDANDFLTYGYTRDSHIDNLAVKVNEGMQLLSSRIDEKGRLVIDYFKPNNIATGDVKLHRWLIGENDIEPVLQGLAKIGTAGTGS